MTIVHIIAGLDAGGAENVLYRLCAGDTANRHFVISLMDAGVFGALLQERGVTVYCLGMLPGRVTVGGLLELRRLLCRHRPDVVQTWMYHADLLGGLAAASARLKTCWGIRSGHLLWTRGQRLTILVRFVNALLSWFVPAAIVSNSARAAEIHVRVGYCRRKISVIPNGIDADIFRPDAVSRHAVRLSWGVSAHEPVIGTVGRDDPYKDYDSFLASLAELQSAGRRFRVVMAGNGLSGDNRRLRAAIAAAGLEDRVILCGPRTDIPAVMTAMDVFVLSSAAEAFPSVLIEAMACGVPCVTTDVGDAASIVGKTGWVVRPREPSSLARAIGVALAELADERAHAQRCIDCRQRVIREFGIKRMVASYGSVWGALCA